MRWLISLSVVCFAFNIAQASSRILALVNNIPITSYEFQERKKMIIALNEIHNPDSETDKKIKKVVLESLIEEELLLQHSNVSESEIDEAIETIAQGNNMTKRQFLGVLTDKEVNVNSFRRQIKAELIKMKILASIARSVKISPKEIDIAIALNSSTDARIRAVLFTSKDKTEKTLRKMYDLQKTVKSCDNIRDSYSAFAEIENIDANLSTLNLRLATIIRDLSNNQKSSIFATESAFQLVLLCHKDVKNLNSEKIKYFLTNKKTSQKAQKFFEDLRKKAYIKYYDY